MSLAQEKNSEDYIGKGPNGEYSIPFRFDDSSWLKVTLVNADGTTTAITSSQYTLSGSGSLGTAKLKTSVAATGTTTLIISRRTPATQSLSLASNAPLPAKDLEKTLDHLAMAILDRDSSIPGTATPRALSFPIGEPHENATRLPMPQRRKGLFIGFHDTTGEMQARPLSVALHATINQAQTAIAQTMTAITQGLAAIENAKTATLTVLNNALSMGTELLAKIPLFYKTDESGGIKLGQVNGDPTGQSGINLQTHRTEPWQVASGRRSIVIGNSEASGDDSVSIGNESVSSYWTTTIGLGNRATLAGGSAFGYRNLITGISAVALGSENNAESYGSVSVGVANSAAGQQASAFGYRSSAGGNESLALGYHNTAVATGDCAVGRSNMASGQMSVAYGVSNSALGAECAVFGVHNQATQPMSAAIGRYNHVSAGNSGAIGHLNTVSAPRSIAFGYRTTVGGSGNVTEMGNMSEGFGARVRADARSGMVALSFGYRDYAPTYSLDAPGHEPSGMLSERMLSFRWDGYQLHIDVAIHGTIKTLSFPLP